MKHFLSNQTGLTILELMVIIAVGITIIIGGTLLLSGIRASSRDKERIDDIAALSDALETYRDTFGVVPCGTEEIANGRGWVSDSRNPQFLNGADNALDPCDDGNWAESGNQGILTEGILSIVPRDPTDDTAHQWWYFTDRARSQYVLMANLEHSDSEERTDRGICDSVYEYGDLAWWSTDPFNGLYEEGEPPCCVVTQTCP